MTDWLRAITQPLVTGMAQGLVRLGIGPNTLTVVGLLLSTAAAILAAQGAYARAGVVYLLGGCFDGMDGAVARAGGKVSRFGALLDSTFDRYGEGFLLTGLAYHLARVGQYTGVVLTSVVLLGSVMVSYTRARSEGLGIENKAGLFTRFERMAVTILALLTGLVMPGLWLLAVFTQVTVVQRVWHVFHTTRDDGEVK